MKNGKWLGLEYESFNPCFSGSCIRIGYQSSSLKRISVSILVLVDLAFEYVTGLLNGAGSPGFNPCFSGSCIRIHRDDEIRTYYEYRFNPCFSGSCIRITCAPRACYQI